MWIVNRVEMIPATYRVKQGSGPPSPFLFNQAELDVLVLLHTLFADPARYAQPDPMLPLPVQQATFEKGHTKGFIHQHLSIRT